LSSSPKDTFKVEATNAILDRLGKDVYQTLKQELQNKYKIELTKVTSYGLVQLYRALEEILGVDSARLLIKAIDAEVDLLAANERQ
jgi:hypothetical protein